MWNRVTLRERIYLILAGLISITLVGGLVMVWYTYRMEDLFARVLDRNIAAFQAAEALETALVNQKGLVSYYFLEGDPRWLKQLEALRQAFDNRLTEARSAAESQEEREAVDRIEAEYSQYIRSKDQVIARYLRGDRDGGAQLHKEVRQRFFRILELCDAYKAVHKYRIQALRLETQSQAKKLRLVAATAILLVFLLGILMAFILIRRILKPVRDLVHETGPEGTPARPRDEVRALSRSVRSLLEDREQTQFELARSRETLLQSEKMALMGKLAAGTAHSIRNPLTSVKMRLFSLSRSEDLRPSQQEDLEVISEEIRHIDNIVQNFLEFARPPKLKMQRMNPSDAVDSALQLLKHRLQSYDVRLVTVRSQALPDVQADPEQLKEVIVNLVVNACEAMEKGGEIEIREEADTAPGSAPGIRIQIRDEGPGIPPALRSRVFQPFFTTKGEGTGLGLSIAARIIEQHGGKIELQDRPGGGAVFVIRLPAAAQDR